MKSEKSIERLLAALQAVKIMCDHGKEIKFDAVSETFSISPGAFTAIKSLGIVVSKGGRKYEWTGDTPTVKMCNDVKNWEYERYKKDKIIDADETKNFESMKIDDKINHINFMLDQIFDRVQFLFENLADQDVKKRVSSDWFTPNKNASNRLP